jgi:hypothetical protein
MPLRGAVVCFFFAASFAYAAELQTVKGEKLSGDIVRISDKEIVLSSGGKEVSTPVAQVMHVGFPDHAPIKITGDFADVELQDGSVLHCKDYLIKGKTVEMHTVSGQAITCPLAKIGNILNAASDPKYRKDWSERLAKKYRKDVLALLREGIVNPLEGTLGDGTEDGKEIAFRLGDVDRSAKLEKAHGLIFLREVDPTAPPALCKLTDIQGDVIVAGALALTSMGYNVTTSSGVKITVPASAVVRLDYSSDKVLYLAQMEPVSVDNPHLQTAGERAGKLDTGYRKDGTSFAGAPITIGGETFSAGLALHAHTELEYDLKGDYRDFRAKAGIDPSYGFYYDLPVLLKIEGDGKLLFEHTFRRKVDTKLTPITLNIKDVRRLRIIVTEAKGFPFGIHLELVEAKVSK